MKGRIYLGMHSLVDIIGGRAFGLAILAFWISVHEYIDDFIVSGKNGPSSFDIFEGHSKATMLIIFNNAAQGILSSFFFKYADTILKKYSSTVATIFTGIASAALFGHSDYKLYVRNYSCFHLNTPDEQQNGVVELKDVQDNHRIFFNM
ncbi:unnamed protein product [Camellia sinensis]